MSENEEEKPQQEEDAESPAAKQGDPVRKWTLIVLGACVVLMFFYLVGDRITPYTTQARVHAVVVPIAAEVSGTVINVAVKSNQGVSEGDLLFEIDRNRYELAVETAEVNLQSARQATGASTASVDAAAANLASVQAGRIRSEQDAIRLRRIKEEDPGAISDRRLEQAEASLAVSISQVAAAEASLEKARQDLGETGDANSRILEAQTALAQAQLDLSRTSVFAPDDGVVTDVRVDRGNFAQAGAPLMTFLATDDIWVQADFTENNLGNIKQGDRVEIVFDSLPGKVIDGTIRTTGFGVNVDSAPLGSLPTIENDRQWLRDAQRFSVQVDFQLPDARDRLGMRVGAQASIIVYTGESWLFNTLGWIKMRLQSVFTYVY
ncbi:MAG: HlyD family secretion protein [Gammaproteobacteria bacterium]|jgi:multidrug resistance efflux pump|nr:HlyD family secretion protein [Gammaproteobacteria bacterium]